ncbi:MAG: dienelactone hydrolase family protein [Novosphingobium sp.]
MVIVSEEVRYRALDLSMRGRLFRDDSARGTRPAVLIFPEGFGISEHTYAAARRVAELGYVGLACDLYGDAYFHNGPSDYLRERNVALTTDQALMRATGTSALDVLHARADVDNARIAAAGYCLGGTIAMELGFAGAPVAAIASFHPSFKGMTYADAANVPCPMEIFLGAEDYASPPETRALFEQAMHGKGVRWRMTVYGSVKHSYTNPNCEGMGEAVAYDEEADRHSWNAMVAMLETAFA